MLNLWHPQNIRPSKICISTVHMHYKMAKHFYIKANQSRALVNSIMYAFLGLNFVFMTWHNYFYILASLVCVYMCVYVTCMLTVMQYQYLESMIPDGFIKLNEWWNQACVHYVTTAVFEHQLWHLYGKAALVHLTLSSHLYGILLYAFTWSYGKRQFC